METTAVIEIGQQAILITLILSGPLLIIGLIVGLLVGVFQAVTQIHEMTLTFIPKILAMVGLLIFLLPWMIIKLVDYTVNLFAMITQLTH